MPKQKITLDANLSSPEISITKAMLSYPSKDMSPGPGAYKLKSMFENRSGFSIPSSKYHRKLLQKPDPWSYIPNDLSVKPKSPNTIFGSSSRADNQKQGPSPAHYHTNYKVLFHSIRTPIIRPQKIVYKSRQTSPGPGNYDLSKLESMDGNNRSIKIGRQKRELGSKQKEDIPAPNIYQSESDIDLGLRKRRGCSIGQKLKYHTEGQEPFNYLKYNSNKEILMRKSPAFTFKKSQKKQENEDVSPGPAKYVPEKRQLKGIVIPKSQRRLHNLNLNPGPQAYSLENAEESPSFSIPRAKHQQFVLNRTPGPGLYTPKLPESRKYKAISIGVGDRPNLVVNDKLPGPGQYNIQRRVAGGFSIGRGERNGVGSEKSGPGPADYALDVSLLKKYVSNYGN